MKLQTREKIEQRLNRVAGQVAGLQKMVRDDRYCVDVLTQIAAIRSALDAVGTELLTEHLETCVIGHCEGGGGAAASGDAHAECRTKTREELLEEVRLVVSRFLK